MPKRSALRLAGSTKWLAATLLGTFVALGACGGSTGAGLKDGAGGDGRAHDGGAGEGRFDFGAHDGGPECRKNEDCKGGFCVEGRCCPSAEQVCGALCCSGGTVCFANACVTPGKVCYSAGDCDPSQYCEPSLGPRQPTPDAGAPRDATASIDASAAKDGGSGGPVCLQPPPSPGRCLDLPVRCGANPTPGCLPACEYRPPVAALSTLQEWHWGEGNAQTFPNHVDVWATPVIGRLTDTNCDGKVNELDPPNIIFVAGNGKGTCCQCTTDVPSACKTGVLRVLDGGSGKELWSLRRAEPGSAGFAGLSLALGDLDRDGHLEIAAVTAEGYVVLIDHTGKLLRKSDQPIPGAASDSFGWGGGLSIADMDSDGFPEVAFGATVFTTKDPTKLTWLFTGARGSAGGISSALSVFTDLDGDGKQELIAGNAAYKIDGSELWHTAGIGDGFPAVGDFNKDGKPEIAIVQGGNLRILDGKTGAVIAGPLLLPGTGSGGPPTVADFDGDGFPEVGVAKATYYSVTKVNLSATNPADKLKVLWQQVNHDFSSSVTGSTVFDFEGDGSAEVIYNDECFLWVYDGKTGAVRFATPTNSFTGTEAALVADVDGDGRAEMVMLANRASPAAWKCDIEPWISADPLLGRPAWKPPAGRTAWSGITVYGDKAQSWVGTRTLWNQHTYHVSNICDSRDGACFPNDNVYGYIPKLEKTNWTVKWLNNFRQNVQDKGLFDAPDPAVSLNVSCTAPPTLRATLRNLGLALLPAGVEVGFYRVASDGSESLLGSSKTSSMLFPGQAAELAYPLKTGQAGALDRFVAKILIDPTNPTFHECRDDNNVSDLAKNPCSLQ